MLARHLSCDAPQFARGGSQVREVRPYVLVLLQQATETAVVPKPRLGHRWRILRRCVLDRDGHACVQCGARSRLEVDHIVPVESGGSDHIENLQTLCRSCHITKSRNEAEAAWPGSEEWREFVHASRFDRAKQGAR